MKFASPKMHSTTTKITKQLFFFLTRPIGCSLKCLSGDLRGWIMKRRIKFKLCSTAWILKPQAPPYWHLSWLTGLWGHQLSWHSFWSILNTLYCQFMLCQTSWLLCLFTHKWFCTWLIGWLFVPLLKSCHTVQRSTLSLEKNINTSWLCQNSSQFCDGICQGVQTLINSRISQIK